MTKSANGAAPMGTMFQKVAIGALIAGAAGMFATGIATLDRPSGYGPDAGHSAIGDTRHTESAAPVARDEAGSRVGNRAGKPGGAVPGLAKPVRVTLANSTGKLWDLFRELGYEIEGVRQHGRVPRLFLTSLPADIHNLAGVSKRKVTFIKSTLPLILHVNEQILRDRQRLEAIRDRVAAGDELSADESAWLEEIADLYGADRPDPAALLKRVDIIPPSLAIAQAAEESGWGTSRFAREGNALFGQRAYKTHNKGIVPHDRDEGKTFRVRAFDHLVDGVKAYAHNLNSHFAYKDFRAARAGMRAETGRVDGYLLAGALQRYSERGVDYISTIRLIMRANTLKVFDRARLGKSAAPDA